MHKLCLLPADAETFHWEPQAVLRMDKDTDVSRVALERPRKVFKCSAN